MNRKLDGKLLLGVVMGLAFLGGGLVKLAVFMEANASALWLYGAVGVLVFGVATFLWVRWRSDRSIKTSIERSRRARKS